MPKLQIWLWNVLTIDHKISIFFTDVAEKQDPLVTSQSLKCDKNSFWECFCELENLISKNRGGLGWRGGASITTIL